MAKQKKLEIQEFFLSPEGPERRKRLKNLLRQSAAADRGDNPCNAPSIAG